MDLGGLLERSSTLFVPPAMHMERLMAGEPAPDFEGRKISVIFHHEAENFSFKIFHHEAEI